MSESLENHCDVFERLLEVSGRSDRKCKNPGGLGQHYECLEKLKKLSEFSLPLRLQHYGMIRNGFLKQNLCKHRE